LEYPIKVKKKGTLFKDYKTSYPFEAEIAEKEFDWVTKNYGKILIYENMFLWYSNYFPLYSQTFNVLMNEEGAIPETWRYYIAIMAVSTIRSDYHLRHLKAIYLVKGGDEDWLINGVEGTDDKIKKLSKINNLLAHQPWKLTRKDIEV
jgi:hypothetical protein